MNGGLFKMPSASVVLLFSAAFSTTLAVPWTGPKPTTTYDAADWTPRPTQGSIHEDQLLRRGYFFQPNVCGFANGNFSQQITCASSSSCVWDTARSFVGCCPPGNAPCTTGVYTGCVDSMSGQQTVVDPAVTTCSGASICYVNIFPRGYDQYQCGSSNAATTVETTFFEQPSTIHLQIVTTSLHIPPASTIIGAPIITNSPQTTLSPTKHSSKPSIGIIIAGAIGGIAVITGLIILIMYLLRKRSVYHKGRPALNNARLARSSSNRSNPEKAPTSSAEFHRLSAGAPSPNFGKDPEMKLYKTPTFPPPPDSDKNPPAPRYFSENESPARSPWSPMAHIPPRFSRSKTASPPVPYVQNYIPRPKTPASIDVLVASPAYEPLRFSPKPLSPIAFTPTQETQREGQLIPVIPGLQQQTREMSPVAFHRNESETDSLEPRRMSPVAYLPRRGAQSPSDSRSMGRTLTPSPSQQSFGADARARDVITPSPSGSQQPLLQLYNANAGRDVRTPSPTFQLPLEPVELEAPLNLPVSTPIKNRSPSNGKHNKNASNTSTKSARYTPIPPLQSTPPRKLVPKVPDSASPPRKMSSTNHIALQLAESYPQNVVLQPKDSQQHLTLKTKSSQQSIRLKNKSSQQSLAQQGSQQTLRAQPSQTEIITNIGAASATRPISPEEREDLAAKFRPKQSSPKNMSSVEYEHAMGAPSSQKGSSNKIEQLLGLVSVGKANRKSNKSRKAKPSIDSVYTDGPPSSKSSYEGDRYDPVPDPQDQQRLDAEYRRRETASVCSSNIVDVAGSDGMGTLPFTMNFDDVYDQLGDDDDDEGLGKKEKGVKWKDEVAEQSEIAELRGSTPPERDARAEELFKEWGWLGENSREQQQQKQAWSDKDQPHWL